MSEEQERCNHCGKKLAPTRIVWLEHNSHHGTWHEANTQPEAESQGHFAFGKDCAKKVLAGTWPEKWGA